MAEYRLANWSALVVRTLDNVFIPNDPANRDRQEYDAWLAKGGVPDPYVVPPPSPEEQRAETFKADAGRSDLMTRLRAAKDGSQIDTFVANKWKTGAGQQELVAGILKLLATDART